MDTIGTPQTAETHPAQLSPMGTPVGGELPAAGSLTPATLHERVMALNAELVACRGGAPDPGKEPVLA